MAQLATFELAKWVDSNHLKARYGLGGSAAPSLSLDDLVALSTDPETTRKALQFHSLKLALASFQGSLELRRAIAALYDDSVTPDHIITAAGTTGANLLVLQSLLRLGDHVIHAYPLYSQLSGLAAGVPCEVSPWRLDPDREWTPSLDELRALIRPNTKMILLNSPNNPTGRHLDADMQRDIIAVARAHNLVVLTDEIFRPLFHDGRDSPPSLVEHDYARTVVTSSMSKCWGMSGTRIGWLVCRDPVLFAQCMNTRQYTLQATSIIDEVIATENLSDRCRPAILRRHLEYARQNLDLLDAFVHRHRDVCRWTRPTAGATAFVQFLTSDGQPVDDVEWCQALLRDAGVLLSPGSLCFGGDRHTDFKGFARVHFTVSPELMTNALEAIGGFLDQRRMASA